MFANGLSSESCTTKVRIQRFRNCLSTRNSDAIFSFSEYFANFGFGGLALLLLVLGITVVWYLWEVGA